MGRNSKNLPLLRNVEILDAGAEGKAVARVEGVVVFTANVIPGDVVDIQVTKKREKYMEGKVVAIQKPSPDRIDAFCEHFNLCGGCKWQYLPYEKQLFYKQKQVVDQLTRIGKVNIPMLHPITGSRRTTFYRNKLEFTFSNRRWLSEEEIRSGNEISNQDVLGFHIPSMFDKVMDIRKCWLQPSPSNEIRNAVRGYALEHKLSFFDLRNRSGLLRTITVRTTQKGEVMVIVVFYYYNKTECEGMLNFIPTPSRKSLRCYMSSMKKETIPSPTRRSSCLKGKIILSKRWRARYSSLVRSPFTRPIRPRLTNCTKLPGNWQG